MRLSRRLAALLAAATVVTLLPGLAAAAPPATPERSTSEDLAAKRYVAAGDRAYVIGTTSGGFPDMGWHITGEMGGVWAHPIKLLDGFWFAIDGEWLPRAEVFTSGAGYVRMRLPAVDGLEVTRTEFAPDGLPVVLVGVTLRNTGGNRTVDLSMDAASELLAAYPWAETTPSAAEFNRPDEASYAQAAGRLRFTEPGRAWTALIGSGDAPTSGATGDEFTGPPRPDDDPDDEFADYGNGTGGQLRWDGLELDADEEKTVWIGVAGSSTSADEARAALADALADPQALLERKVARRAELLARTDVELPDEQLEAAFDWGKLNMEDLRITVEDMEVRYVDEGDAYPDEPAATIASFTGIGAGFPDYPWYFGTDGAYTAHPLVVSGQWDTLREHLEGIMRASRIVNGGTGKVIHELVTDGSVYFGANDDAGNTNETSQFTSAVWLYWKWSGDDGFVDGLYDFMVDGLRYVSGELDTDGDGWPEGSGMVERPGMGAEKLDVTAYHWQALRHLAEMADARDDGETAQWARATAAAMRADFGADWWMPQADLYADSLCNDGDEPPDPPEGVEYTNVCPQPDGQLQQRHWINAVPMETGMAPPERAAAALDRLETDTFTGDTGLYHTGIGGGPDGEGELRVWTLPNSVMAVGEANHGRLGEARFYIDAIADQLDLEQPGALPEIVPSPEYDPFQDFRTRAMFLQAWSSYGVQWPVIHHFLGVTPDAPTRSLRVVPDVPVDWPGLSVRALRVGAGFVRAEASVDGRRYTTAVTGAPDGWRLTIGHTLPRDAEVASVELDGEAVDYEVVESERGLEVRVDTGTGTAHTLTVTAA